MRFNEKLGQFVVKATTENIGSAIGDNFSLNNRWFRFIYILILGSIINLELDSYYVISYSIYKR